MLKIWKVLPYFVFAGLMGMIFFCYKCGGEQNMKLEIAEEDGFLEWGTCAAFAIAGLLAFCAAIIKRKMLTKRQVIFLVIFAAVCFMAVGEELSWGQRIFGFAPPKDMTATSNAALKFGHNDVTWHNMTITLGHMSFSLGGALFGVTLIVALAIHGIVLPILYKKRNPKIVKAVDKLGMFLPPLDLGILVTAATLLFYILRRTVIGDMTEPNEFKEFFVPVVYAAIIAVTFFKDKTKADRICLEFFLVLFAIGMAICAKTM